MNVAVLKQAGIDYDKGVARFLDDDELYQMVLTAFLEDDLLEKSKAFKESQNYKEMTLCVHELKGSCGNTDMTRLYNAVCELIAVVKSANYAPLESQLEGAFSRFEECYIQAKTAIKDALED